MTPLLAVLLLALLDLRRTRRHAARTLATQLQLTHADLARHPLPRADRELN